MSGPLALVYPVMAQVLHTFALVLWSGGVRSAAVRAKRVRLADVALSNAAGPEDIRKIGNNLQNQFETPILFYALCGTATYVGATNIAVTLLAWAYVATRVLHTFVHVTNNWVPRRFAVFCAGMAILIAIWVVIVAHLFVAI